MRRLRGYEHSRYVVGDWIRHRSSWLLMFSENRNACKQGTWVFNGLPCGGFSIHPMRWLNEEERFADEWDQELETEQDSA